MRQQKKKVSRSKKYTFLYIRKCYRVCVCKKNIIIIVMSSKNEQMPTSYANPAFDEDPNGVRSSTGPSPMGSNIFIVKPDDEKKSRVHPQPHRHEPVTQQNIGRMVLRGIRCKNIIRLLLSFVSIYYHFFSTLGNTTNRKRSSKK